MGTKRLLTLLTLVAILGGVAIWNINTMQDKRTLKADMAIMESPMTPTSTDAVAEADLSTAVTGSEDRNVGMAQGTPANSQATTAVGSQGSMEADMQAFDTMYAEEYDDSSLDTTFSNDGATVLAEPYDI